MNNNGNNDINDPYNNRDNNKIISMIQGKNELKEYEMNGQSPQIKGQTYYLSNQFSHKVK